MFDKRAFVHWYTGEGMDEGEFVNARNVVLDICGEYCEANNDDDDDCDDDEDVWDQFQDCNFDDEERVDCKGCTNCGCECDECCQRNS